MSIDKGKINLVSSETHVSVYWIENFSHNGCVESDRIDNENWWISRALVKPTNYRSKGIGSKLLKILIDEIKKKNSKYILVTPGGYEDETEKQFRFYEKNGFVIPDKTQLPVILAHENIEHLNKIRILCLYPESN